uniref:PPM-type phosphatase domain-containing protein n=1 Tax=Spongospora subterranea TaxID=70186 RepID=A0A0H5R0P9_9EUKA|eukprot:CRZ01344.1 hypothetical protein [Spongospora subterranea]
MIPPRHYLSSSIFLRHGVHQDRGRRTAMEDTHMIEHHFTELVAREMKTTSAPVFFPLDLHSVYFGLFDGHAGVAAAEFCKRNLHRNIARSIPTCQNMAEAMSQG